MPSSRKFFWKRIIGPSLQRWHRWHFGRTRRFAYKDVSAVVAPGIFPPQLTFSTRAMLDFLETVDVKDKSFLELGCGCGIISLRMARRGASVTASDIHRLAVETVLESASENNLEIEAAVSDLFDQFPERRFEIMAINPPYYPKNPGTDAEKAWYCGEDFGYFKKLFAQLPAYLSENNQTFMVLSDDCERDKIKAIAEQNGIAFQILSQRNTPAGREFIFRVSSSIRAGGVR